jgi:hypothetical protein
MRLLGVLLVVLVLVVGCGDDDGGNGGGATTTEAPAAAASATTSEDARIEGAAGKAMVEVTIELLNATNGDDPCFAIVASDYVESLGGLEGCAKKMEPIATGPLDTITHAAELPGGETGEVHVESSDGSQTQTIKFAKSAAGKWNIDGLGP